MNNQEGVAKAPTPNKALVGQSIDCSNANNDDRNNSPLKTRDSSSFTKSKQKKGIDHSFPVKLHYMLTETDKDGLSYIVSWQPHGRCFLVHDQQKFVELILPNWFRQSKIASFQRQLNMYDFKRITTGRDKGAYYHSLFLKGKPDLAEKIQRTKIKGTGTRKPACPETEPNFYNDMKFFSPSTLSSCSAIHQNSNLGFSLVPRAGDTSNNTDIADGHYVPSLVECQAPDFVKSDSSSGRRLIANPFMSGNSMLGGSAQHYLNPLFNNESPVASNGLDIYKYILQTCMSQSHQSQGLTKLS